MTRTGTRRVGAALALVVLLAACSQGNVFSLDEGTCFDDVDEFFAAGGGEVGDVPIVECDGPHDNEVYALFDIEGEEHPGAEAVEAAALDGCFDRFASYVGREYETSRFDFAWLTPTPRSWEEGDREVVCFLYDVDLAVLEGSAAGSGE